MPLGGLATAGLIIGGAGVITSGIESIVQNNKANQIKPTDPHYNIPSEFYQNREIARQMAEMGLPTAVTSNAANTINANEATALATAQNSSNPAGAIASITGNAAKQKANLSAEDAQARDTNQRFFINENAQLGDQKLAQQQSDVFDKFTRDFNQYQALKGASMQNMNNAITGAQQLGETAINYAKPSTATYQQQQFANRGNAPVLTTSGTGLPGYDYSVPNIPLS